MTAGALRPIFVQVHQAVARLPPLPEHATVHLGEYLPEDETSMLPATLEPMSRHVPVDLIQQLLSGRGEAVDMRLDELAGVVQALRRGPCSFICASIGASVIGTGAAALCVTIRCHCTGDLLHGTAQF